MNSKPPPPDRPDLTINRFPTPRVTTADIVENVFYGRGGWKTLQRVYEETLAEKRAKALSDRFDMVPIPTPEFDNEDWHL